MAPYLGLMDVTKQFKQWWHDCYVIPIKFPGNEPALVQVMAWCRTCDNPVHWRINAALRGDELTNVHLLPIITQRIYLMNGKSKLNVSFFQWTFESLLSHASGAVYSKRSVWTFTVIHTVFHSYVAVKVYHHFQDHDKYSYPGSPLKTFHSAGVSGLDPSCYTMPGVTVLGCMTFCVLIKVNMNTDIYQHIEAVTKWTPFRRRHFQVHFRQ